MVAFPPRSAGSPRSRRLQRATPAGRRRGRGLASLILLALAGCTGVADFNYITTVSGGERIEVPITRGMPAPGRADGLTVTTAMFFVHPAGRKPSLAFEFVSDRPREIKSVRIEDVSESVPVLVLEDPEAKLTGQRWRGITAPFTSVTPPVEWLAYLDDTNRVYRFTVIDADGRRIVMHQLARFPGWMKGGIRQLLAPAATPAAEPPHEAAASGG